MIVAIIGTGYVGLPTGIGFAELGNDVICIDREQAKIDNLKAGKITLFEEGLEELFYKNVSAGKIHFTTSMEEGVSSADMVVIAVGTPPHPITKDADMKYIHAASAELAPHLKDYTVIAIKSTVPIGTGDDVESLISKTNPKADFDVVSIPEFLREGCAVYDFFNPDRIIVGTNNERPIPIIKKLYQFFDGKTEFLYVKRRSSETIKYASNAFLAVKIHYINEMADFCEKTGADIKEVASGMGLDTRIGKRFLLPGPGYGGSCFPKDTLALSNMAIQNNVELSLVKTAIKGNAKRREDMANRIMTMIKGIENPVIGVLGLAFKNNTDDCRESPAIAIISHLLDHKVNIVAYDPKAIENAQNLLGIGSIENNKIQFVENAIDVAKDADILVVLTEWEEFKLIQPNELAKIMKTKKIFDCRNILDKDIFIANGFEFKQI